MDGTLTALNGLSGELSGISGITGELSGVPAMCGELTDTGLTVVGALSAGEIVYEDVPAYDGSYEVTPLPGADTILDTRGYKMLGDVTVQEIPYTETSNEAGGYTVIIG